ncbi:MAG: hypothetical protein KAY37_04315 [Phycisphaerae bacterium]|nr:hypothetical protein [Phycisphaerae bacterium]
MRNAATSRSAGSRGPRAGLGLFCGVVTLATLVGCGRTMTIHQAPYINTASQANRPVDKRTGEPLELAIVCVYPGDLDKTGNELLRPDSKVTAKEWFERRPTTAGAGGGHFDLPKNQVYVLTNDDRVFGRHIGKALRGAVMDGEKPIKKTGIKFESGWTGGLHDDKSVIYVFGKFIGRDGDVLPVSPAKFHPPGAYRADLEIQIDVDPDRPLQAAQYIKVLSKRKMHGKSE